MGYIVMKFFWLGHQTRNLSKIGAACAFLLAFLIEPAFAQDLQPINSALEAVVGILTGTAARLVAIIAVVIVGYMAFLGQIPWRWAASIIFGIVLIFGAATIVDFFIGAVG